MSFNLTDAHKQQLQEQGFVILENLLTADETDDLRRHSVEVAAAERAADSSFVYLDGHAQRVWNLVNKGEIYEQAIQRPEILAFMAHLLGDDFTLSSFTVNTIGPGAAASELHLDQPLSKVPVPRPSFPISANSMWFLDDFSRDNGATWVVPGSHQQLIEKPQVGVEYPEAVQVEGSKGSVMIMNGAIWHRSGAHTAGRDRVALLGFFCRAFLKPQQDHLSIVDSSVVERATPTLRRLLGYDSRSNTLT